MTTPWELIKKYGLRPRKGLGQSFLIDPNIIGKIVNAADIGKDDRVIEIGAGLGVMTARIAERAQSVVAIDVDPVMIGILRSELMEFPNLTVLEADVLTCDFASFLDGMVGTPSTVKVLGNIPYNISSQILFHLLSSRRVISSMVLMFQKEVADRITASPGGRDYGILSVLTARYARSWKMMAVPPHCFYPKPRVDSAVLKFEILDKPRGDVADDELFTTVVRTAFARRRKTLLNNLRTASFLDRTGLDPGELLASLGIDGRRRGETLTVEEFVAITRAVSEK
ncbi:MAG: ribosomal RNA small subunit methyltransferase A [Deltaproteobacteria bacterium]|nr:ribosomal RNA small subunit methyltransferase A [Deltaproteobacteria bacterium]